MIWKVVVCHFRNAALWVSGLLLVLSACHGLPQKAEILQPDELKEPYQGFKHCNHDKTLKEDRYQCADCHLMAGEKASDQLSLEGRGTCHDCHVLNPKKGRTRLKCSDCHFDLNSIKPTDHLSDWRSTHGSLISLSKVECSQCHSGRFCAACHNGHDAAAILTE